VTSPNARYVVGIDLGTTNSAIGYVDTAEEKPQIRAFEIPQVTQPGVIEGRSTLPSFLYIANTDEFPAGAFALPWHPERSTLTTTGEFARSHGWKVPMRLVSSAKSWLCATHVDRTAAILPWGAPDEIGKLSPVAVSTAYLRHLRGAWDHAFPQAPLAEQDVFLTVPASFDAVARELTVRAAVDAGLPKVTLLEEPQAAFYAWLGRQGDAWRKQLEVGDVVLVCDIGGGTTDFSLIAASEQDGNLVLERVAVGDHILLGGDNMDLTLAHQVRARLEADGHKLDNWQMASLVHSCRQAKEDLLNHPDRGSAPIVVLGRGSKLIGGSIKTELSRAELDILLDGFFPLVEPDARPQKARRTGLRELGLPFAADPAVTRHLAGFLGGQREAHRRATAVLFNGGVMKGRPLRQRIVETLDSWSDSPEDDLKVLEGNDLDLAVAHGAAYYGLVRRGKGVRIRGGTARAYYIGIESSMPAVPGMSPPLKALCVAPFGMEEGTEAALPDEELGLVVGEPAEFRFLSSSTRRDDRPGTMVDDAERELAELAPVSAALPAEDGEAGQVVPVTLKSRVTEIGTLELWCEERGGGRRWKLEYNVREESP
jgi:molecular chaperone DnaK (HSP70)